MFGKTFSDGGSEGCLAVIDVTNCSNVNVWLVTDENFFVQVNCETEKINDHSKHKFAVDEGIYF